MHSLGNTSKFPSGDSLSSTPSLLLSESEQTTEDEADVFSSEGEGEAGGSKSNNHQFSVAADGSKDLTSSLHFGGQRHLRGHPRPQASMDGDPTEGDLIFGHKCAELHSYIRPLLELLNGLKAGRFDRSLTSFQHSVAMDRLQRIVGILQKPDLGEKYLPTILQIEILLKVWFPHVTPECPNTTLSSQDATATLPGRWHQNQRHMPVKKRRLSLSDSESLNPCLPQSKCTQSGGQDQDNDLDQPSGDGATSTLSTGKNAYWADNEEEVVFDDSVIALQPDDTVSPAGTIKMAEVLSGDLSAPFPNTQDSSVSSSSPISDTLTPPLPPAKASSREDMPQEQSHSVDE